ncbi:hypothetical protein V6N12_000730 [Hibiscus sabdariffa]|uniref:Uncharacterized protein n=2 Tax=Hibiscus sabdariffa TaxID=183260 RepID=A0ABR2BX40_9ROSI
MNWNEAEWGNRPNYLMRIFSPIDNEKDVMIQLVEDRVLLGETTQNEDQQQALPLLRKQSEYQGGLPIQEATSSVHTDLRGNSSPEEEGKAVAVDSQQFDHLEPMVVSRADESAESTEPAFEPALPGVDGTELSVAEEPELSIGSQQATYENVEQASNEADVVNDDQTNEKDVMTQLAEDRGILETNIENEDQREWRYQPYYLMDIFSPLNNEEDMMTQLAEDNDLLETIIENEGQQPGKPYYK